MEFMHKFGDVVHHTRNGLCGRSGIAGMLWAGVGSVVQAVYFRAATLQPDAARNLSFTALQKSRAVVTFLVILHSTQNPTYKQLSGR